MPESYVVVSGIALNTALCLLTLTVVNPRCRSMGPLEAAQLLNEFKGVSDYVAAPAMCSAATSYSSIKASRLKPGQWSVFPGGGGDVGIQGVQLASAMGLRPIVVDTGEDRRKLAMSLGAEHFIDFRETDPVKSVIDLTSGGAHGVFVTGEFMKARNGRNANRFSQLYNHIPSAWNISGPALEGKSCGKSSSKAVDCDMTRSNRSLQHRPPSSR